MTLGEHIWIHLLYGQRCFLEVVIWYMKDLKQKVSAVAVFTTGIWKEPTKHARFQTEKLVGRFNHISLQSHSSKTPVY